MSKIQIICRCGQVFSTIRIFNEHRAMLNPRWPRSDPSDAHGVYDVIHGNNDTPRKDDDDG